MEGLQAVNILKVLGIIAIHAFLFALLLIFYVFPVIAFQATRDWLFPPAVRSPATRSRIDD